MPNFLTPSRVTLAAAIQALVIPRLLRDSLSTHSQLKLILSIFGVNYAALVLHFLVIHPLLLSRVRNLPGPKWRLTALQRSMVDRSRPPGDIFLDVMDEYPEEEVVLFDIFQEYLLATKPKGLADVLVHKPYDFIKPENISGFLRHVLGDGLIVVEGEQHKFLRKNSLPAFSFRHIKDLYPMIWDKALLLTAALRTEAAEAAAAAAGKNNKQQQSQELPPWAHPGTVEVNSWASRVTLDIIGVAGLGREFNMLKRARADPLMAVYEELLEPTKEKLAFFLASAALGETVVRMIPWRMNSVFKRLSASLYSLCGPLMQEKREAIVKKGDDHFDVLSLLVKSGNFSDRELTDQLLTYLAAGHETTSSAFSWTCYLLAKHQDIQAAVRKEVKDALPHGCADIDPSTDLASILESLPLLNGIINETLRLYPTVPISMREAIRDTTVADTPIPKGARILLVPWAVNRSPQIWGPDATQFKPQRWINADDGKPNLNGGAGSNYHFLTFLHGPRSCIGQGFARAELRCLLATVVAAFDWTLGMDEDKVIPGGVITIKPAHGMYIKLRPLE